MVLFVFLFFLKLYNTNGCSTIAVGRLATTNNSVLIAHSNDGNGDVAGNINIVDAATYDEDSNRTTSHGSIPQVRSTYKYFTEGYAIQNEHQVSLGESTCVGVYDDIASSGVLNIVDLSQICLERATTALQCVQVMGSLAETYGYNDAAESLFVGDRYDIYLFHVLKDSSGSSAIWAAKQIDPNHVSTVMNAFVLDEELDLTSSNFASEAAKLTDATTASFKKTFSGINEETCPYTSGRRMWAVLNALQPTQEYNPYYDNYLDCGYPLSFVPDFKINSTLVTYLMRNTYENTPFDMATVPKLSGGPIYSPSRWATSSTVNNQKVCWERPIGTFRSIVSLISETRPTSEEGIIWFAPHSALTSEYAPFMTSMTHLPKGYTSNSLNDLNRNVSAYWAFRYLYQVCEIKSYLSLQYDVKNAQAKARSRSLEIIQEIDKGNFDVTTITQTLSDNAKRIVSEFWTLSDTIVMKYADGWCSGDCPDGVQREIGYDQVWLDAVYEPPVTRSKRKKAVVRSSSPPTTKMRRSGKRGDSS